MKTYKALKHKVTGEWGSREPDMEIYPDKWPDLMPTNRTYGYLCKNYVNAEQYELVTVELREVGEVDNIRAVVDFANKIAKALSENRSSTALFFLQQAFPEEIDSISEDVSAWDIVENIEAMTGIIIKER